MHMPPQPELNLRTLRPRDLLAAKNRHLLLLLYWPVYLLLFLFVEQINPPSRCHVVHCALDDMIPFCEAFLIPYALWFVLLVWMSLHTLLYDRETFIHYMQYIILTYTTAIVIYLIWPTCQQLRPAVMPRDNILTRLMSLIYRADTSTNVCPSIHVLGSLGVFFASREAKGLQTPAMRCFITLSTILICLSTIFLKQHSVIDVLSALPLGLLGYSLCFRIIPRHRQRNA